MSEYELYANFTLVFCALYFHYQKPYRNWISQRSSSWGEVVQVNTQALITEDLEDRSWRLILKTAKETKHTKQPSYILVWEDPLGWVKHFKNASESSLILSLVARKEVCKSNAQGTGILYAIYSVLKGSVSTKIMQITYDTTTNWKKVKRSRWATVPLLEDIIHS